MAPQPPVSRTRRPAPCPPAGGAGAVIGTAIRGRWRLSFICRGAAWIVDPHVYGVLATGELALRGVQATGRWDTFELASIEQLDILAEPFRIDPKYDPDDPKFAKVYAQV
jgi:hypothetical protein